MRTKMMALIVGMMFLPFVAGTTQAVEPVDCVVEEAAKITDPGESGPNPERCVDATIALVECNDTFWGPTAVGWAWTSSPIGRDPPGDLLYPAVTQGQVNYELENGSCNWIGTWCSVVISESDTVSLSWSSSGFAGSATWHDIPFIVEEGTCAPGSLTVDGNLVLEIDGETY